MMKVQQPEKKHVFKTIEKLETQYLVAVKKAKLDIVFFKPLCYNRIYYALDGKIMLNSGGPL